MLSGHFVEDIFAQPAQHFSAFFFFAFTMTMGALAFIMEVYFLKLFYPCIWVLFLSCSCHLFLQYLTFLFPYHLSSVSSVFSELARPVSRGNRSLFIDHFSQCVVFCCILHKCFIFRRIHYFYFEHLLFTTVYTTDTSVSFNILVVDVHLVRFRIVFNAPLNMFFSLDFCFIPCPTLPCIGHNWLD